MWIESTLPCHMARSIYAMIRRHEAVPGRAHRQPLPACGPAGGPPQAGRGDRKSTRLNSSHGSISYAVFCLKKKNNALQLLLLVRDTMLPIEREQVHQRFKISHKYHHAAPIRCAVLDALQHVLQDSTHHTLTQQ